MKILENNIPLSLGKQRQSLEPADPVVDSVVERISQAVRPEKVFLFGSRASGHARNDSDIDLLLLCPGAKDKRQIKLAAHRLFDHPQFSLDVFVLTPQEFEEQKQVANTLAREVFQSGRLCYG